MPYLNTPCEIRIQIAKFALAKTLWLDTEIAGWQIKRPQLSLIQVLAEPIAHKEMVYILDVLNQPDLVAYFIDQIMINPNIEKVFHNKSFDLKYLGGSSAQNVTCTWQLAKKICQPTLKFSNLKLKTLAVELCHFSNVDVQEQKSDWGKRPLSQKQLDYAAMDVVYLAAVYKRLLEISHYNSTIDNYLDMSSKSSESYQDDRQNCYLSATKVRVALECPRLFYLHHNFGGNSLFQPEDNQQGVGIKFHKLVDEFIKLATTEPRFKKIFQDNSSLLNLEEVASQMQQLFYQLRFYSYLEEARVQDESKAQLLFKVWQGLKGLIHRFAKLLVINRSYCNWENLFSNTFISEERKLEHNFDLPDGTRQRVLGEFDCLVFNWELKRLCVVEFKTYQPVDPSAQLAQVALYSYMLWCKKNLPVDSAVYCVLPEFKEYTYTWEELESTIYELIPYKLQQMRQWLRWKPPHPNPPPPTTQPYLCSICPQREKCQAFFNLPSDNGIRDSSSTNTSTNTNNSAESANADAIGQELVTILKSFGIDTDYQGAAIAPSFIRVKLKPHLGVKTNSLLKLSADLQVQMGLDYPPLIAPQAGYVSIDLPRLHRQVARFEDYIKPQALPINAPVKIAIGVDLEGRLVEADLSDPNTCHFLVGGTTGSGKSEFLRSLLLSLIVRHSPKHLQIVLVDPKRVTFLDFEQMRWLRSPIAKESASAIALMNELIAEMDLRYEQFEKLGCGDLSSYNKISSQPLPRIVCIFDEYADFMVEKESRTALEQSIKRLGAMARAAGIHLIIATQRPEAKIVTPVIRSNLPGRVALRTASEADSDIVLGGKQAEAAYLLGKGDLLYKVGAHTQRLQSLLVTKIQLPEI